MISEGQKYIQPTDDRIWQVIQIKTKEPGRESKSNPMIVKLKMLNSRIFKEGPEFTNTIAGFQKSIDSNIFKLITEEAKNEEVKKKSRKKKGD
jgi:hypothetical protein